LRMPWTADIPVGIGAPHTVNARCVMDRGLSARMRTT
jgi:hypothetical protein